MRREATVSFTPCDKQADFHFGNIASEFGATERYFTRGDEPWLPAIGEYHFSRYDADGWAVELAKIKAQGLAGVSVYVFWNHHEYAYNKYNFTGNNDIARFLTLCREIGLNVILRIGGWCHGEVRFGGFPDYLRLVPGKRTNAKGYMNRLRKFWEQLYKEVASFCDGSTVIGLQMENEYTGKIDHIIKLREMAEAVGFKVPYFTMTAWPTNTPHKSFVPLCGGYPEAPWTWHKKPLLKGERFKITDGRSEAEIGNDLFRTVDNGADFSKFPYAGCEVGTGNQVTQHRRPIISDIDGYGVAFAKFASGMNLMGYYMYHGGRNPQGRLLQESKRTLYPNNYPIIDYDFQAPLSKDGEVRRHADRLRLMHYFFTYYDKAFGRTQAFFDQDKTIPYFSVRGNEKGGVVFLSNYERSVKTVDQEIDVVLHGVNVAIDKYKLAAGKMIFFPYNCNYDGVKYDYITAQPILIDESDDYMNVYFMKCGDVRMMSGGKEVIARDEVVELMGNTKAVRLHFLDEEKALKLYYIDDNVMYAKGNIYQLGGDTIDEHYESDIQGKVTAEEIAKVKLPYNYFLYSKGGRKYYEVTVDKDILNKYDDIQVDFSFIGLNLQLFHNGILIDDYFNTDGNFRIRLARIKQLLMVSNKLIIRAAAATNSGVGNVYNEINMPVGSIDVSLTRVTPITKSKI